MNVITRKFLTEEELFKIESLLKEGKKEREIGRIINRSHGTVLSEVNKNKVNGVYSAKHSIERRYKIFKNCYEKSRKEISEKIRNLRRLGKGYEEILKELKISKETYTYCTLQDKEQEKQDKKEIKTLPEIISLGRIKEKIDEMYAMLTVILERTK